MMRAKDFKIGALLKFCNTKYDEGISYWLVVSVTTDEISPYRGLRLSDGKISRLNSHDYVLSYWSIVSNYS